jgi:hypothetical protein
MVFWNQGGRAFILIPVTVFYGSLTLSCVQAFLLYTVDKIVASLIKQVSHSFFSSGRTSKFRVGVRGVIFL